jgi:Tol biopolymer transport system component
MTFDPKRDYSIGDDGEIIYTDDEPTDKPGRKKKKYPDRRYPWLILGIVIIGSLLGAGLFFSINQGQSVESLIETRVAATLTQAGVGVNESPQSSIFPIASLIPPSPGLPPGSPSAVDAQIVFVSSHEGNEDIYALDSMGRLRNLTQNPARDLFPAWSPDGSHIAFRSDRDGVWNIYVMDADGGHLSNLTHDSAHDNAPVWSPDGLQLAFPSYRHGSPGIDVIDARGANLRTLTPNNAISDSPAWSPDSSRIAFSSDLNGNWDLYEVNVDASNLHRLTDNGNAYFPSWSPDGSQIAFMVSDSSKTGSDWEIYVMNADGSNARRLTDNDAYDASPSWAPDGQWIAFESDRDALQHYGYRDIYLMRSDGSDVRNLTNGAGRNWTFAWSPDGLRLAFWSDRAGRWDIYSMNADGTQVQQLTHLNASETGSLAWRP